MVQRNLLVFSIILLAIGVGSIQPVAGSITPVVTEVGKISWSIDGLGMMSSTGLLQVEKPVGATVRSAYMAAATPGHVTSPIQPGDIKIDGVDIAWPTEISNSISSLNYWADVTSLVKTKIDAAPAGRIDFTITEAQSNIIDGELLVVIFDDPAQTTDNTICLLFGAQQTTGDDFNILLADPVDLTDPTFAIDFSLASSFSYQGIPQYSIVEMNVNGGRLTSWAGGNDDGEPYNGALFTVGGLDDSTANPPDPNAMPVGDERYDDELYSLLPFVSNGDTQVSVHTQNPSNDDNLLFAGLFLRSTTAIVGEGVLLSPATASNPVGTLHSMTATVQDANGNPIVGRMVTIAVTSGPNAGTSGSGLTDADGKMTISYTSSTAGTDTIVASFVDDAGNTITSAPAANEWIGETEDTVSVTACKLDDKTGDGQTVDDAPLAGWPVMLTTDGVPGDTQMTGSDGCYTWDDLPAGPTYGVSEEVPATGWTATSGTGHSFGPSAGGETYSYTFTNFQWSTLSGYKFYDLDSDGTFEAGEPGLDGWTIVLKEGGTEVETAVTDPTGYYEFTIKEPGSYTVEEVRGVAPWVQTTPAQPFALDVRDGAAMTVNFGNRFSQGGDGAGSIVTSSGLCSFGDEFRLIYTPDPANAGRFTLTASNPGQFYYHVFDIAAAGDAYTIALPEPFVTQGAQPVHVYSALHAYPTACLETDAANDVTSQFTTDFSNPRAVTVTNSGGYTGFVWITVHCDFGWKKVSGYGRDAADNAVLTGKAVNQGTDYTFGVTGGATSAWTITNLNIFKKNPGFGGTTLSQDGTPIPGVKVEIYTSAGKLLGSAVSDADGYYMYSFKHTGKPTTYTLKVPAYSITQTVSVKSNAFVARDFTLP